VVAAVDHTPSYAKNIYLSFKQRKYKSVLRMQGMDRRGTKNKTMEGSKEKR
jgi:hypothetical protein